MLKLTLSMLAISLAGCNSFHTLTDDQLGVNEKTKQAMEQNEQKGQLLSQRIRPGMTREQVEEIMGHPEAVDTSGQFDRYCIVLGYERYGINVTLMNKTGVVPDGVTFGKAHYP